MHAKVENITHNDPPCFQLILKLWCSYQINVLKYSLVYYSMIMLMIIIFLGCDLFFHGRATKGYFYHSIYIYIYNGVF